MPCTKIVPNMSLVMGNYTITYKFFVVDWPDSHVELGVQWLYSIGTHTVNYQDLELAFTGPDGKKVKLIGLHAYPPKDVISNRMEAGLRHGDILWVVECRIMEKKPVEQHKEYSPDIMALCKNTRRSLEIYP